MFSPFYGRQQELEALKRQADYFTDALKAINERIGEIESRTADKTQTK
jgi:hypothetical protein